MPAKLDSKAAIEVMTLAGLKPLEPYVNSNTPWKCECGVCGKVVEVQLQKVKYSGRSCPECGKTRSKTNRLHSEEFAYSAMLKAGWRPLSSYQGKNNKTQWESECIKCGETSKPNLGNVLAGRGGCGYCNGNKVNSKKAIEIMMQFSLKPLVKYPGAGAPWKSRCIVCLQTVYPRFADVKYGIGCAYCSGRRVNTEEAEMLMMKAKLKPLVKYPGAMVPWSCLCLKCERKVSPLYNGIQQGRGGCIFCVKTGIQYDKPAYIYLMNHQMFQSIKIGISGKAALNSRLEAHKKYGWEVFQTKDFTTGIEAERVETSVLNWLRAELLLGIHLPKEFMPQGGHTETVDATEIDLPTIWAKVLELSRVKR